MSARYGRVYAALLAGGASLASFTAVVCEPTRRRP
jgi:hypothetical protein